MRWIHCSVTLLSRLITRLSSRVTELEFAAASDREDARARDAANAAIINSLRRESAAAISQHNAALSAANADHAATVTKLEEQLRIANDATLQTGQRCDRLARDVEAQV